MASALQPLRLSAFRSVASAYALGQVADWVVEVALALAVYERTGSPLAAALVFVALRVVPVAALPWASRRSLASLAALRACAVAALAFGADALPVWALLALGLADGAGSLGGRAGSRAATTRLFASETEVRAGNAVLNVAFAVAAAAAPGAAGLLVVVGGVDAGLAAGAALVALGAVVVQRVGRAPGERARRTAAALASLRERRLRVLVAGEALLLVLFTAAVPVELPYAVDALGVGEGGYGLLLTAWGAGTVAGSLAFAALGRVPLPALAVAATVAVALAYGVMGIAPSLAVACAGAVVGGAGNGVQWVAVATWVQRLAGRDAQAGVAAVLESVAVLAPAAGFLLGGLAVTLVTPRAALLATAVAIAAACAAAIAASAWSRLVDVDGALAGGASRARPRA